MSSEVFRPALKSALHDNCLASQAAKPVGEFLDHFGARDRVELKAQLILLFGEQVPSFLKKGREP